MDMSAVLKLELDSGTQPAIHPWISYNEHIVVFTDASSLPYAVGDSHTGSLDIRFEGNPDDDACPRHDDDDCASMILNVTASWNGDTAKADCAGTASGTDSDGVEITNAYASGTWSYGSDSADSGTMWLNASGLLIVSCVSIAYLLTVYALPLG